MSSRRDFLTKSFGLIGVGAGSVFLSKLTFDESKNIEIAKTKTDDFKNSIIAAGHCGLGMGCSGGNGQCGLGMGCSGS